MGEKANVFNASGIRPCDKSIQSGLNFNEVGLNWCAHFSVISTLKINFIFVSVFTTWNLLLNLIIVLVLAWTYNIRTVKNSILQCDNFMNPAILVEKV